MVPFPPSTVVTIPSPDMVTDHHSPPSPKSRGVPIPNVKVIQTPNAIAGPSSEGAIRRDSQHDIASPSSAPPTPSLIGTVHPSKFIHTHHPRRASLTPLGLNLISPVAPHGPPSPVKSIGFTISADSAHRRESTHSSSSTLNSRLASSSSPTNPPGFNPSRRRSSLTPSLPTLAQASPTKAHASGRVSRPTSSDGREGPPPMHARTRTSESPKSPLGNDGRRGSLPQLQYGGWTGPQRWNPSLPPQRGSMEEVPVSDFKFGSTSTVRSPSLKAREEMSAFELAEADEAERQQRAFLEATYGGDGIRARERLSIGGPTPSGTGIARRQSLMLWEKMGMTGPSKITPWDDGPASAPPLTSPPITDDFGPRRGSLPIAIPQTTLGRVISTRREQREARENDMDAPADERSNDEEEEEEEDEDSEEIHLTRPLPPLLPLSDPGPRLLPSTLALHRASHLLSARNLESEPLPHPLPPSLHPPAPVDLAEFDIDFILAGSQAQLGRDKKKKSNNPPKLKLGREDEDTFAKFVGEFDDEYGDRRGEWTFRACPPSSSSKCEWESQGAGKYEVFTDGVRSVNTNRIWKVKKMGVREYELEDEDCYVLTGKDVHCEHGGIKRPIRRKVVDKRNSRLGSDDSSATATAVFASSLPLSSHLAGRKPRTMSATHPSDDENRVTFAESRPNYRRQPTKTKQKARSASKDRSFSGFKKGLINSIKSTYEERKEKKEEKERDRAQSQSWSGGSTASSAWSWSAKSVDSSAYKTSPAPERNAALSEPDEEDDSQKEGKGWKGVPDDAVAMVVPLDSAFGQSDSAFEQHQALLVWFVPFNSDSAEDKVEPHPSKLPKLLRRRTSKDKDALKVKIEDHRISLHPLPFRSFRVVARMVDMDQLRPESDQWHATTTSSPSPSLYPLQIDDDVNIKSGRTFPTVIAVCHSRSQGVEFVLEGLDRLGLCKGDSAWGPTGYEEWRGTGLSEKGREILDLLWAGCTCVMGLCA